MKNPSLYMLCHNLVFYTWMWLCMCVSVCLCLRNPLLNLNIEVFCSIKYSKCIQWLQSWCDVDNHFDYEKACDKIILILVYRQNLIYLRLYFNYIFIFIFLMVKIYFSKKKEFTFLMICINFSVISFHRLYWINEVLDEKINIVVKRTCILINI